MRLEPWIVPRRIASGAVQRRRDTRPRGRALADERRRQSQLTQLRLTKPGANRHKSHLNLRIHYRPPAELRVAGGLPLCGRVVSLITTAYRRYRDTVSWHQRVLWTCRMIELVHRVK